MNSGSPPWQALYPQASWAAVLPRKVGTGGGRVAAARSGHAWSATPALEPAQFPSSNPRARTLGDRGVPPQPLEQPGRPPVLAQAGHGWRRGVRLPRNGQESHTFRRDVAHAAHEFVQAAQTGQPGVRGQRRGRRVEHRISLAGFSRTSLLCTLLTSAPRKSLLAVHPRRCHCRCRWSCGPAHTRAPVRRRASAFPAGSLSLAARSSIGSAGHTSTPSTASTMSLKPRKSTTMWWSMRIP